MASTSDTNGQSAQETVLGPLKPKYHKGHSHTGSSQSLKIRFPFNCVEESRSVLLRSAQQNLWETWAWLVTANLLWFGSTGVGGRPASLHTASTSSAQISCCSTDNYPNKWDKFALLCSSHNWKVKILPLCQWDAEQNRAVEMFTLDTCSPLVQIFTLVVVLTNDHLITWSNLLTDVRFCDKT